MTKLILVRHGQSVANFKRIFTGNGDFPLTELGKQQALAAGKYIKAHEDISAVYASPLSRAYETGSIIAKENGVPIITCEGLMEIYAGEWEGRLFDDIEKEYPESYSVWRNDIGHACPDGGESVKALFERCFSALEKIIEQNPDSTIVLATHATPIRSLSTYWQGIDIDNMKDVPWPLNASLTEVCFEKGRGFFDLRKDLCEHLAGIETALPSNV